MRRGLSSIDHAERPGPSGARAHFGDRVDRAQHVRDVRERHDTRAPGQQALDRLEVERAVLPEGNRLQNRTAVPRRQLPRNDVRVVFELRDQHLIARPQGAAERHSVAAGDAGPRSEEHTSELQSPCNLVCRLLLEKKKTKTSHKHPAALLRYRPTKATTPDDSASRERAVTSTPHCTNATPPSRFCTHSAVLKRTHS